VLIVHQFFAYVVVVKDNNVMIEMSEENKINRFFITMLTSTFVGVSYGGVDLNSDGYSEIFSALHSEILANDPTVDTDQDGFTDAEELIALTDPLNPNQYLSFQSIDTQDDSLTFVFNSQAGVNYILQSSLDLSTWNDFSDEFAGQGGAQTFSTSKEGSEVNRFYRLRTSSFTDSDGDSIPDWEEELLGFDPNSANSVRSESAGGDEQHLINLLTGASPSGGIPGTDTPGTPSEENASRFLSQATFGPNKDQIDELIAYGDNAYENWIDAQLTVAPSYGMPYLNTLEANILATEPADRANLPYFNATAAYVPATNLRTPWLRNALNGQDRLRQRVAWGLSQIFVVSTNDGNLIHTTAGILSYNDHLIEHGLGNFYDLLKGVSQHPVMGIYLGHLFNQKADPATGRKPDENFAREIMQLFSIGLYQLNQDGSFYMPDGVVVETYDNSDIEELARVFTGLKISSLHFGSLPILSNLLAEPMEWDTNYKDLDPKAILAVRDVTYTQNEDSVTLNWSKNPLFQYVVQFKDSSEVWHNVQTTDISSDLDISTSIEFANISHLGDDFSEANFRVKHYIDIADPEEEFNHVINILKYHPNTAPFMAHRLIQHMVSSNPSPEYISRVSSAFVENDGDMSAMVKAILLDPEARGLKFIIDENVGKLRAPILRMVNYARALEAGRKDDYDPETTDITELLLNDIQWWGSGDDYYDGLPNEEFLQLPYASPSVFNFFKPEYSAPGNIIAKSLLSPEFEIFTPVTSTKVPNQLWHYTNNPYHYHTDETNQLVCSNNYTDLISLCQVSNESMLDRLNLLLCSGAMTSQERAVILSGLEEIDTLEGGDTVSEESVIYSLAADEALSINGPADKLSVDASVFTGISNEVSISVWLYGDADILPTNTTFFTALGTNSSRVLNIHLPWSDGTVYWDAGAGNRVSYSASAAQYSGQWNHLVFTKDASSGVMRIYINGSLVGESTNSTAPITEIASADLFSNYFGEVRDLQIFNQELNAVQVRTVALPLIDLLSSEDQEGYNDAINNHVAVTSEIKSRVASFLSIISPSSATIK